MTVRTLLESASSHTEVQIWSSSDHRTPIIGEMMEAGLGHKIQWFHYQCDDDEEEE